MNQSSFSTRHFIELLLEANELRSRNEFEGAIKLYLEALEQYGENDEVMAMVAACHYALGRYSGAIMWIKRAIQIAPDKAQWHCDLAEYLSIGTLEYHEAASEYRIAMAYAPNDVDALVNAAALYGVPEQPVTLTEAIEWLKRASELRPGDANIHARLAMLYRELGEFQGEQQEWIRALLCFEPLSPGYMHKLREGYSSKQ